MKTLIVAGGILTAEYVTEYRSEFQPDDIIAADKGLDVLREADILPDLILGDYDSTALFEDEYFFEEYYQRGVDILNYPAEKDFTDTEAAIQEAVDRGSTEIHILGGTGGRLDHFFGIIQNLLLPLKKGIRCVIADEWNRIELIAPGKPLVLKREECFGQYVSLIPFEGAVHNVTLTGMKYPLQDTTLEMGSSLGISNEVTEETAEISFSDGILIMVQSKDRS